MLGPAPEDARFEHCTLARAHRPTVWGAFESAVSNKLQQRAYRLEGGSRARGWTASGEWRVLSKLGRIGQAKHPSGAAGRRQARALRSLEYRIEAARGGGVSTLAVACLPPTRKQRAMESVAKAVAAAASAREAARVREEQNAALAAARAKLAVRRRRSSAE